MPASSPFSEFLSAVAQRGRSIIGIRAPDELGISSSDVIALCHNLLSSKGDASGIALSFEILERYQLLDEGEKLKFFEGLADDFAADGAIVQQVARTYLDDPTPNNLGELSRATVPPRTASPSPF